MQGCAGWELVGGDVFLFVEGGGNLVEVELSFVEEFGDLFEFCLDGVALSCFLDGVVEVALLVVTFGIRSVRTCT